MHTLCSDTREAPKRSLTNFVGLAGILQQFHDDRDRSPDLLLALRYTPASVGHNALRTDKRMYTLFSETREAVKRNQMSPVVGILQPFYKDGNCCLDVRLEFRYTSASVGHKALRADKGMHTLCSETREVPERDLANPPVGSGIL
jgi:hypothetical protein